MWEFTDEQKALVLEAEVINDDAVHIFLEMCDATIQADKLRLLEQFHDLNLQEIAILARAGDPATADKLAKEELNYQNLRNDYLSMVENKPAITPQSEFEAARLAVVWDRLKQDASTRQPTRVMKVHSGTSHGCCEDR